MPTPLIIEPIVQKSTHDCAIAALAMLLGKPYAEVSALAVKRARRVHGEGLSTRQINNLAKALGTPLRRYTGLLDDATALLHVVHVDERHHTVLLFQGIVVNPGDGLLYDLDAYLASAEALPHSAWVVAEDSE